MLEFPVYSRVDRAKISRYRHSAGHPRGHDHMSTWMSSLINVQDGCLQMVAQRASMGRAHQEHLAQQVAQRSMMPSMTTDQVAYLRAQLAHRDAQLEQVRAERDNHFVQEEEEVLALMRLFSLEAKIGSPG